MARLVIRGGSVVDGTGDAPRPAEVLVVDGRIGEVDVKVDASGAEELDASGALVTPGFIDSHTHLDPSLFWDRAADPLPQHGVTSVLIGNCSLGLAPMRRDQIDAVSQMFCYIEDIPRISFDEGIPWGWETYAEYVAALGDGGLGVHAAPMIGHSVLRMYVMGDEAWEREASAGELAELTRILGDVGRPRRVWHVDVVLRHRRLRPSRTEPSRRGEEHAALIDVLARKGRGLVQIVAAGGTDGENMRALIELCGDKVVSTTNTLAYSDAAPSASEQMMAMTRDMHAGVSSSGRRCRRAPSTSASTGSRRWYS